MNTSTRGFLLALAFSVTVAAGVTGLSMAGQSKETSVDPACVHTTWPMIPAECLAGADTSRTVRPVYTRTAVTPPQTMAQRFASAFN